MFTNVTGPHFVKPLINTVVNTSFETCFWFITVASSDFEPFLGRKRYEYTLSFGNTVSRSLSTRLQWSQSCPKPSIWPVGNHWPLGFWVVLYGIQYGYRADSRLAPSQWQTSLQRNAVSQWLGANLKPALRILSGKLKGSSINQSIQSYLIILIFVIGIEPTHQWCHPLWYMIY